MKYYLVQGKETDDSADDSFTYHYASIEKDFTLNELETLALDQYCNDRDIDRAKMVSTTGSLMTQPQK